MNSKHIDCDDCDGVTETRLIDYEMPYKRKRHKFTDIEAEVCPKCGEIYIQGNKALEMEREIQRNLALTKD